MSRIKRSTVPDHKGSFLLIKQMTKQYDDGCYFQDNAKVGNLIWIAMTSLYMHLKLKKIAAGDQDWIFGYFGHFVLKTWLAMKFRVFEWGRLVQVMRSVGMGGGEYFLLELGS